MPFVLVEFERFLLHVCRQVVREDALERWGHCVGGPPLPIGFGFQPIGALSESALGSTSLFLGPGHAEEDQRQLLSGTLSSSHISIVCALGSLFSYSGSLIGTRKSLVL